MKVLCVRGQCTAAEDDRWRERWEGAIREELSHWQPAVECTMEEAPGGRFLDGHPSADSVDAVLEHLLWKRISDRDRRAATAMPRTWRELPEKTRWYAALVARWSEDTEGRGSARISLRDAFLRERPDILIGAGLGSLTVYDTFARASYRDLLKDCTVITLGSQLGNPHVRAVFGGKITALSSRYWFNLVNPFDDALSAPLQEVLQEPMPASKSKRARAGRHFHFREILTALNQDGIYDDDPVEYLKHKNARYGVWRVVSGASKMPYDDGLENGWHRQERPAAPAGGGRRSRGLAKKPDRKALIVGIADYPNVGNRLAGCVNDAYLVSELLQEWGYDPAGIRLLLNDRATADALRTRLEWLLRDAPPGSERVFYYAGHGAQIGSYGIGEHIDSLDECLVPYDFDWSIERAVTDDWFYDLYSQLAYTTQFTAVLDCCHAGGMNRDGAQVRGINPPGDIRHRLLEWNPSPRKSSAPEGKWTSRFPAGTGEEGGEPAAGQGHIRRLGNARALRALPEKVDSSEFGHVGPYKPVIMKACAESQVAQEHFEGSVAYGAFTYALHRAIEKRRAGGGRSSRTSLPSPQELVKLTRDELRDLGIEGQDPQLDGPTQWISGPAFVSSGKP